VERTAPICCRFLLFLLYVGLSSVISEKSMTGAVGVCGYSPERQRALVLKKPIELDDKGAWGTKFAHELSNARVPFNVDAILRF